MADATLPTASLHHGGHGPFWMRVRHEQKSPGRIVQITAVIGELVTITDGPKSETLWTHPPAAKALKDAFDHGLTQMSRFGRDIFIARGLAMSLVDPAWMTQCDEPDECFNHRVISIRTGKPWDVEDTLAYQEGADES